MSAEDDGHNVRRAIDDLTAELRLQRLRRLPRPHPDPVLRRQGVTLDSDAPGPTIGTDQELPAGNSAPLTAREFAERYNLSTDAARKRLERYRAKHPAARVVMSEAPGCRQARLLYPFDEYRHLFEPSGASADLSGEKKT